MRYTVRHHDTLGDIASRFGVSVSAIMHANGLRHYQIYPGQVLWIPVPQYHQHYHYHYPTQPPSGRPPYHYGQSTQRWINISLINQDPTKKKKWGLIFSLNRVIKNNIHYNISHKESLTNLG